MGQHSKTRTISHSEVLLKTAVFVRRELARDSSGHDWQHVDRVRRLALFIGEKEGADPFLVELSALLHDLADWKFHGGDVEEGPRAARRWLEGLGAEDGTVQRVAAIVREVSFKGAGVTTRPSSLEGAVVQDADRLDALGAIGIARAFAYGGSAGRRMHDPEVPPQKHATFEEYKKSGGTTLNHFYEKLLLLKDRMNTPAARAIAEGRHRYMREFLERFLGEWQGEI